MHRRGEVVHGEGGAVSLDLLGVYARLRVAIDAAGNQQAYARSIGISPAYLSDVLNARREPGDSILRALGLRKQVRYVEARSPSAAPPDAADPRPAVSGHVRVDVLPETTPAASPRSDAFSETTR